MTPETPEIAEINEFEKTAALAFFASAWAEAADEQGADSPIGMGAEIMDIMPSDIDPAATRAAFVLRVAIERANNAPLYELMGIVERDGGGGRDNTVEMFGHYAAMEAMGHGVGLRDAFGQDVDAAIKIPHFEFGSHSLEREYF